MSQLPDWARAYGAPVCSCRIRSTPADFVVTEVLDIDFSEDGEHDWLWIEKTGANTTWVAERLARHARVHPRDVGYSGLKDRHAVTSQWFSVRRPSGDGTDWDAFSADGVRVLGRHRHQRKLKRGAHRGNAFRVALRGHDFAATREALDKRLAMIAAGGVPNYFGEQRFGHDGGNIELGEAALAGKRMSRNKRSIGFSALRSLAFNNELSARVAAGTWNALLQGDTANLDGSGSIFEVDEVTADLAQRCADMDIHPCGQLPELGEAGVRGAHRPLRMRVAACSWEIEDTVVRVSFGLPRGCFATSVLRELVDYRIDNAN